jgi:hypothetical protein
VREELSFSLLPAPGETRRGRQAGTGIDASIPGFMSNPKNFLFTDENTDERTENRPRVQGRPEARQ